MKFVVIAHLQPSPWYTNAELFKGKSKVYVLIVIKEQYYANEIKNGLQSVVQAKGNCILKWCFWLDCQIRHVGSWDRHK